MSATSPPDLLPRGPHRLSREEVVASQRGRLLQATIDVVAERGYARCAVADVIARAGVSRGTFYEQFTDKEDCFLAAYDTSVELLLGRLAEATEATAPGTGSFAALIDGYLATIAAEPVAARIFLIEVYSAGPAALARRFAVLQRFVDLIAQMFKGAPGWPTDPTAHSLRSEALVGALSSMVTTRLACGRASSVSELRDTMLVLAGVTV
jgi:AcrR family transcriptional regulator